MSLRLRSIFTAVMILVFLSVSAYAKDISLQTSSDRDPIVPLSLKKETLHSLKTAFGYLLNSQLENGSWKNDPAITAIILYAFLLNPADNPDVKISESLRDGFNYLESFVKPDGGIYRQEYRNYTTAVALVAFAEARTPRYDAIVTNAKKFLIQFQLDEGEGIDRANPYYGGIGYGGDDRPDLSNTQLALEAIKAAEDYEAAYKTVIPDNIGQVESEEAELGLHWRKALVFLARTQNVKEINDMPYASDDGGFIYETGHYKKERSHSYGSMTYAGVKSLIYAQVDKHDIRVRKALSWIFNHYTLDENPGFGTVSLYYYYMTAAKCLYALGEETITDGRGVTHRWREEFLKKLISIQYEDGYWVNHNGRFWENIKDLTTAYAVISMKFALKHPFFP